MKKTDYVLALCTLICWIFVASALTNYGKLEWDGSLVFIESDGTGIAFADNSYLPINYSGAKNLAGYILFAIIGTLGSCDLFLKIRSSGGTEA